MLLREVKLGKRGSKNVINAYSYAKLLETHPSKMHLIAGVTYSTAKINILDCDGFGLLNYYEGRFREGKYKNRDCVYLRTLAGEKIIIVAGGETKSSFKSIKGYTLGSAYITEVNECHETFVREVFDRTLSSPKRKIFHDLNPKPDEHWYYKNVLDIHDKKQLSNYKYGLNYGHFTIADNSSISDDQLKEVLNTYDINSIWFKADILGLRSQAEGLIYPMFNRNAHVVNTIDRPYERYWLSNDFGVQHPCVFQLWGLCDGVYYLVKEYFHDGKKHNMQKTDSQYHDELKKLINDKRIYQMYLDNAPIASTFNVFLRQRGELSLRFADNEVLAGIRDVTTALVDGKIKINDCCIDTIKGFNNYFWAINNKEHVPLKENDDCMDCLRYFVRTNRIVVPKRRSLIA